MLCAIIQCRDAHEGGPAAIFAAAAAAACCVHAAVAAATATCSDTGSTMIISRSNIRSSSSSSRPGSSSGSSSLSFLQLLHSQLSFLQADSLLNSNPKTQSYTANLLHTAAAAVQLAGSSIQDNYPRSSSSCCSCWQLLATAGVANNCCCCRCYCRILISPPYICTVIKNCFI
jgi:hypothetical protein